MEIKHFLQSRTIWSGVLMLLIWALPKFGVTMNDKQVEEYLSIALEIIGFIGVILFRYKAVKKLTL